MPRKLRLLAGLLLASLVTAAQSDPRARKLCGEANQIARELTVISGLELHHPVPCDFISKDEIHAFLKKRVKNVASPEEIRSEELTLKMFGLVPQEFDLEQNTVDLLTEQAAAFYDYNKKKLFITETTPSETQEPVLAHELSHALADQTFNLAKFIKQGRNSDDGATARLAVMEGQATWLMSEYLARRNGQTLKDSPALVAMMSKISDGAGGQYPVFESEPLYLRTTLVFPYTTGMLFQNTVFQRDGQWAFFEVFRRPPVSTQQIIHPERYFENIKPTQPALPDPHLSKGYKGLIGGSLGELEHQILLEQYAGKDAASEIAPHWRGCTFELRENKAGRVVLLYAVDWDSEQSARRYFATYRRVLARKWKHMSVASETADSVAGTGDAGGFKVQLSGSIVTSVEGLQPAIH